MQLLTTPTDNCTDVCGTPQCGDPKLLTVLVPVIYDEIGINVCRTIPLATLLADYPTAAYIRTEVTNITFATGAAPSVTIKPIAGRPNCYELTLTNLTVDFVIYVYDCCKRLLATLPVTGVVYLPSATTDPEYDEDTNPTSVTMQLFAPYGVTYTDTTVATPNLNFIGFLSTNGTVSQGLNLMAMSKVLNFDIANAEMTVGLTLIVQTIYYHHYRKRTRRCRRLQRSDPNQCGHRGYRVCLHELCKRKPLRPEHQAIGALQSA